MTNTATATGTRYIAKCRDAHVWSFVGATADRYGYGPSRNCPTCAAMTRPKAVKGTVNEAHACNEECTSASGLRCSCACGGDNHGLDFAGLR